MRYILVRFDGPPTKERPCGMKDIIGIGNYISLANAERYLMPRYRVLMFGGQPATHLGMYDHMDRLIKEYKR